MLITFSLQTNIPKHYRETIIPFTFIFFCDIIKPVNNPMKSIGSDFRNELRRINMPNNTVFQHITPKHLQDKIDKYFAKKQIHSMTGLALHLGVTRNVLVRYNETDLYGKVLQNAKLRCENQLETKLILGTPPTGIIFILKNNYGWSDKIEIDQTVSGTISLAALFDRAAQQKLESGKKQEIIEGQLVETATQEILFDTTNVPCNEVAKNETTLIHSEELPNELF